VISAAFGIAVCLTGIALCIAIIRALLKGYDDKWLRTNHGRRLPPRSPSRKKRGL
jgi:hypothetical protein